MSTPAVIPTEVIATPVAVQQTTPITINNPLELLETIRTLTAAISRLETAMVSGFSEVGVKITNIGAIAATTKGKSRKTASATEDSAAPTIADIPALLAAGAAAATTAAPAAKKAPTINNFFKEQWDARYSANLPERAKLLAESGSTDAKVKHSAIWTKIKHYAEEEKNQVYIDYVAAIRNDLNQMYPKNVVGTVAVVAAPTHLDEPLA